ncbi:MAG: hypothetical protein AAF191_18960, partial [Verrucomicrobiota bacterium]
GTIAGGTVTEEIGVTTDLLASFVGLVGGVVPTDRTTDGKDVTDLLLGKAGAKSPHELHYYEVDGIRRGDWKLVKGRKKAELFNLKEDLGEKKDLSKKKPELVEELMGLLEAHAKRIASETRPAAFVEKAQPILTEPGDLPMLRDYVGKPETTAEAAPDAKKAVVPK